MRIYDLRVAEISNVKRIAREVAPAADHCLEAALPHLG
jgi:hypothetical protein